MSFVKLKFPPGVVKPATIYEAAGRWFETLLVRWHDGVMQPMGGWTQLSTQLTGVPRKILAWRRLNRTAYIGVGTNSKVYVYNGTLYDITPEAGDGGGALVAGPVDSSGTAFAPVEACTWQMDAYGEDLVGVSTADKYLRIWDSSAGTGTNMQWYSGSPTDCRGVVTTPEQFLFVLGYDTATDAADGRAVSWPDQASDLSLAASWTILATNQAGSFPLETKGNLMAGRATRTETLLWTEVDIHAATYIGGTLVYSFRKLGNGGAISRNSMAMVDGQAYWMSQRGFYTYDGFVKTIACPVGDYVFNRLVRAQAAKVYAEVRSDFNEIWWHYPATGGTENSEAVVLNYLNGDWRVEVLERTCGMDRGFLDYPVSCDASGYIYEHEKGLVYQDTGDSAVTPYAKSGPLELGNGDTTMMIRSIIPDEETQGEVSMKLHTRFYPNGAETEHGPYTMTNPTDARATGRQVRVEYDQVTAGWRVGTPRLDVIPSSER
jgi:hypothetical protein